MTTVLLAAGESFAALLMIVNPLAAIPAFISLTDRYTVERRRDEARSIAIITGSILLVFMLGGEALLHFFGLSLEALQVAGGLLIGFTGFNMVAGPRVAAATAGATVGQPRIAFAPMAVPLLAGPGAMGAVMALDARDAGALKYVGFAVGIIGVTVIVYMCMRAASRINAALGDSGLDALTRILGLFIFALGAEMVIHGIVTHGAVTKLRKI